MAVIFGQRTVTMNTTRANTTDHEFRERYARQIALPQFGIEAQQRLAEASALIVGIGGLGAIAAGYLAAAGIGKLGLVDHDTVALTNLHRQILYTTDDAAARLAKTDATQSKLRQMNPHCEVVIHAEELNNENAVRLVTHYDIVLDGTDSHQSKYAINRACLAGKKPLVYGGVFRFEGQVSVLNVAGGPCLECIYPENSSAPGSCSSEGVLGTVPGIIGIMQAQEIIKWATGVGQLLNGRMFFYDALQASSHTFAITQNPHCRVCRA